MRSREMLAIVGATLVLGAAATAAAADPVAKCKDMIAKSASKHHGMVYKALATCHLLMDKGKLPPATDCTAETKTAEKIASSDAKARLKIGKKCGGVTAGDLGYPSNTCPTAGTLGAAIDCILDQNATTASRLVRLDRNLGFQPNDTLPGYVLRGPTGSMADVRAAGTFDEATGEWSVIFTRALTTPFPEEDRQFDGLAGGTLYYFGVALLDDAFGALATMGAQDPGPYTLGRVGSGADLEAENVAAPPASPTDFTGDTLVTTPAGPGVPAATLRAAYDTSRIYVLVTWPDDDMDDMKQHWHFDGTSWMRLQASGVLGGEAGKADEDRVAIFWDINAEDFTTEGCMALCHADRMRSRNTDGRADLWHWKAARTNPLGYADDQRLRPVDGSGKCPLTPCRQDDTGTGIASDNKDGSGTLPSHMPVGGPGARYLLQLLEASDRAVQFTP